MLRRIFLSIVLFILFISNISAQEIYDVINLNCDTWLTPYKEGDARSKEVFVTTEYVGRILDSVMLISVGNDDELYENSHFPCNISQQLDPNSIDIFGFSSYISFNTDQADPDLSAFEFGGSIWSETERRECVLLFQFEALPYLEADIKYHIGGVDGWQELAATTGNVEVEVFSTTKQFIMDLLGDGNFHYINLKCSINESGEVEYQELQIDDIIIELNALDIPPSPPTTNIYNKKFVTLAVQADGRKDGRISVITLIPSQSQIFYKTK